MAAKAAPDGYTLTMISSSHAVNVGLYTKLPYDLVKDLAPITQLTRQPYALVINPSVPAKSVKELIALAKAKPGTLNYGSSGTGGISHLAGALLGSMTGIELDARAVQGRRAGDDRRHRRADPDAVRNAPPDRTPRRRPGRLRALAVTTAKRWPGTPELPTMQEAGVPGFEITQWYGLLAPAKTPPPIVDEAQQGNRAHPAPARRQGQARHRRGRARSATRRSSSARTSARRSPSTGSW